jgi:hypothetical protein
VCVLVCASVVMCVANKKLIKCINKITPSAGFTNWAEFGPWVVLFGPPSQVIIIEEIVF